MIDIEKEKLRRENSDLKKQLGSVSKELEFANKQFNSLSKRFETLSTKFGLATKEIKSLKGKLFTSERKRKLSKEGGKKIDDYIQLIPIARHQYPELIVKLSVHIYANTRCGFRGVVTILKALKEELNLDIEIPCYNTIKNWVLKSGYSIYHEPFEESIKGDYIVTIDDSMMVGSQRLLLILGCSSKHPGKPLSHNDVAILGMAVRHSWDGESIRSELEKVSKRVGRSPLHVISDNASIMKNGVSKSNLLHIRDISHTLGMILERVYKKDKEFKSFMKKISLVKSKAVMTLEAYLLPPKQRDIARFLNLSKIIDWATKMLKIFNTKLSPKERKIFAFIPKFASFINELDTVISCINTIEKKIKNEGLSRKSVKYCIEYVKQNLYNGNERMKKVAEQIMQYLKEEAKKFPKHSRVCWNASSDVIESVFGVFKDRKSPNSLHGVTTFIFLLPLHTRIGTKDDSMVPFDYKHSLESVFMREIRDWEKKNLFENQVSRRTKILNSA